MPFNHMMIGVGGIPRYTKTISISGASWKRSVDGTVADDGRTIPTDKKIHLTINFNSCQWNSASTSTASVEIDQIDSRSTIVLNNNDADILGKGGAGGLGGANFGGTGSAGGLALRLNVDCRVEINNGSGFIFGGGGGGGGAGSGNFFNPVDEACEEINGGSGGGGGAGGGAGGAGGGAAVAGAAGNAGTTGRAGAGGAGGTTNADGGNGGGYGAAGTGGATGAGSGPCPGYAGAEGGAAGQAVKHNASTTLVWLSGNDGTHVKGSIGT